MSTATIVCILIGRDYCTEQLFNYFKQVQIPSEVNSITLRMVAAYDECFESEFQNRILELTKLDKFDNIITIPGVKKIGEQYDTWADWELHARVNFISKHQNTCDNLNRGIQSTTEDFIHIIDDDTIPPHDAMDLLYQELISDEQIGMTTGMYFSKVWDHNPKWRSKDQRTREVCASVKHHNWVPSTIDEFAVGNVRNIKWCGNGCMLTRGDYFRDLPELRVSGVNDNHALGPDWHMCDNINATGKVIRIDQVHVVVNRDIPGKIRKDSNIHIHQFNIQGDMRSVKMEHERYIYKIMNKHPRIHITTDLDFTVGFTYKDIICSTYMEDYFCR